MTMPIETSRRTSPRIPMCDHVMVLSDDRGWFTRLQDLSESGCAIKFIEGMQPVPDEFVRIFFVTDEGLSLAFHGRITHTKPDCFGVEFIRDEDHARVRAA